MKKLELSLADLQKELKLKEENANRLRVEYEALK
jgi:hypothetical protein